MEDEDLAERAGRLLAEVVNPPATVILSGRAPAGRLLRAATSTSW